MRGFGEEVLGNGWFGGRDQGGDGFSCWVSILGLGVGTIGFYGFDRDGLGSGRWRYLVLGLMLGLDFGWVWFLGSRDFQRFGLIGMRTLGIWIGGLGVVIMEWNQWKKIKLIAGIVLL